ncbi:hypothetical protein M3F59_03980 [Brachybacterium muris]|nr:hypothetical protein [Brachybacterium muris]MCT2260787.1 hypothetical protein [Brachybacterium muris]
MQAEARSAPCPECGADAARLISSPRLSRLGTPPGRADRIDGGERPCACRRRSRPRCRGQAPHARHLRPAARPTAASLKAPCAQMAREREKRP